MMNANTSKHWTKAVLLGAGLVVLSATGCQSHIGGQTLPSPYYTTDDVQYFQPGPEFILEREASAMREASREEDTIR